MVVFEISGKVALVSGGARGLGYQYVLELLRKGAKGVTIADVAVEEGNKALKHIETEFGKNKAIFVETDITDYDQFEDAFKTTIDTFNSIDILINNAGIYDDFNWQREIEVNMNGTIHGILLGLEDYIPKYKSGSEGVIVNISSVAGITAFGGIPPYTATKFAIHGMTLSWGLPSHYNRTNVRVVGVCPGSTITPMFMGRENKSLGPAYEEMVEKSIAGMPDQTSEQLAPHLMTIIEKAPPGTMWVVEGGEPPYQFILPDRFTMPKVFLE